MKKITKAILPNTIRQRPVDSYKGTYGRVVLIGGNRNFGGAIIMASEASVYSGAGLVTTITDSANQASLHARLPEAMVTDFSQHTQITSLIQSANVVVVGPGLGDDANSVEQLKNVLATVTPSQIVIIDGSAISILASNNWNLPTTNLIFTPHQMEWQRLSGIKIADQTETSNQQIRKQLNATVVLKSHRTEI